jgi:hypothetical protein
MKTQNEINSITTVDYIKLINDMRLSNKDKWVNVCHNVNGYEVAIKSYNAWIQRLEVKGFCYYDTNMNAKPKDFKDVLNKAMKAID